MQYEILCFRTSLYKFKEIRTYSILSCRIHSNTSIKFLNGGFELYLFHCKVFEELWSKYYRFYSFWLFVKNFTSFCNGFYFSYLVIKAISFSFKKAFIWNKEIWIEIKLVIWIAAWISYPDYISVYSYFSNRW